MTIFFQAPGSATGEDVLELHVHGGLAVVDAVLHAISSCRTGRSRVRYAEPGEFTRRAFFNNRLDLTQVEALGDVLSAATEQQRKLSLRGTTSQLALQYERWRAHLLHARSELEALIDFSEDQHFDESPTAFVSSVASQIARLKEQMEMHLENAMRGELLRNGIRVSLLGSPNAGKSSLLNRIVGRDAAIVSHEAGTTRDIVEVGIDLGGYLCRFGDMAGLRVHRKSSGSLDSISPVEEEGIKRAKQWALESDIVVIVIPVEQDDHSQSQLVLDPDLLEAAAKCADRSIRMLAVINKIDILDDTQSSTRARLARTLQDHMDFLAPSSIFETSCTVLDHDGVDAFKAGLVSTFESMTKASSADRRPHNEAWRDAIGASERHRSLLGHCLHHLDTFIDEVSISQPTIANEPDVVLAAEALRAGANCLAKITGRGEASDVEEVLGVIFERFCVGK